MSREVRRRADRAPLFSLCGAPQRLGRRGRVSLSEERDQLAALGRRQALKNTVSDPRRELPPTLQGPLPLWGEQHLTGAAVSRVRPPLGEAVAFEPIDQ